MPTPDTIHREVAPVGNPAGIDWESESTTLPLVPAAARRSEPAGLVETMPGFSFGSNWSSFSRLITDDTLTRAMDSIRELLGRDRLDGETIVDIGCGSGLFSQAFLRLGAARVTALDADPLCVQLTERRCASEPGSRLQVLHASILDASLGSRLERSSIGYAWGSLHHTGSMWSALERASTLVEPGGVLVAALYNRHWTSAGWRVVKRCYGSGPEWLRSFLVSGYAGAAELADRAHARAATPQRGMDRLHDIRDWLGGWPYEYASANEVARFAAERGWPLTKLVPCRGRTGCNQFVFQVPHGGLGSGLVETAEAA